MIKNKALSTAFAAVASSGLLLATSLVNPAFSQQPSDSKWKFDAGVVALNQPNFEGAEDRRWRALPSLNLKYNNRIFVGTRGVGVNVINQGPLRFSAALVYSPGRDEDDDERLEGLGDIDNGIAAQVTASWLTKVSKLSVIATRRVSGDNDDTGDTDDESVEGLEIDVVLGTALPVDEHTKLKLAIGATYADDEYMEDYFSVNAIQSVRSGLARYEADAGVKSANATASLIHALGKHWTTSFTVKLEYLLGDAADSPIVERDQNVTGIFGLNYHF